MAHIVSSRHFKVRHHGTVAEALIGSPVILVINRRGITVGMRIAHGHIADERHRIQSIETGIIKQGIVRTRTGLRLRWHLAKSISGTNTKIIVLIP